MKNICIIGLLLTFLYSCSGNSDKEVVEKNKLLIEIKNSEKKMFEDSLMEINIGVANNAIKLYSQYANSFPEDTASPEYLFRAGELCKALSMGKLALTYYERIEKDYPEFPKLAIVIFMQGYINETQLANYKNAKYHYERYIEKYPKSKFSEDLKVMIRNLGRTDQELIKSFQEKEKSNVKPNV